MNKSKTDNGIFDCIVIGGGHAGVEAANAAAKLGAKTLLLTIKKNTIAKASCNPAIGGIAKGQIVREIDALGGVMALAADATGLQFRILNRSKGPAVQSPRAQIDKYKYSQFMADYLEKVENLEIAEGLAAEFIVEENRIKAVRCKDGRIYRTKSAILTAGTFLKGIMHTGTKQWAGGRLGEPAAEELSDSLVKLGFDVQRLKTGTPARLDAKTVDYEKTQIQKGDDEPVAFSFMNDKITQKQLPCWITYTNKQVHKLLLDNIDRAPLYSGQIKTTGPRYCPSIETKIMRFKDKDKHQIFLEPEDSENTTIYCNGISTSVPEDIQEQMLKMIAGTENAKIVHYAYAIEYDYFPAMQLKSSLETKKIAGLFFAGQVNGTSGYEEAAAQGIMAGINAAKLVQNKEPVVLGRHQAYIGVLIDDLLSRDITEPYRMFTSRAEWRLSLRSDNADRRLTPVGRQIGLVDNERWQRFQNKKEKIEQLTALLKSTRKNGSSYWQILKQPKNELAEQLADLPEIKASRFGKEIIESAVIDARYEGYLIKQEKMVAQFKKLEAVAIPENINYDAIVHLRAEARENLKKFTPQTLGQAGRISGITPADIVVLQIYLKKIRMPK